MPEAANQHRSHKRLWIEAAIGVVLLAIIVSLGWYLRSPQFADFVRGKLVVTLEEATGGRVELDSFHWKLSQLAFEATGLTIHGLEGPDQLPYVHVDRALVRLHIISFVERRVSLEQLELQHPVIHLIVYADGSTNAPEPKQKRQSNQSTVQQLFDLAIARADVHDGMLLLNERRLPLDFTTNDVAIQMTYDHAAQRYDGEVQVGKMDAKYQDFRDIAARAELQFSLWRNLAEIKSLKLTSEKSSLQASGKIKDFQRPEIQLSYSSTLDIAQLGAVARLPQVRGGTLLLDGSGAYSDRTGYSTRGRIAIRDLNYLENGIALRNANLNSNFSFDNNNVSLTRIAARLLGGQITGDAEVKNLLPQNATEPAVKQVVSPARSSKQGSTKGRVASLSTDTGSPQLQQGSAQLRVTGLSLSELARVLSTRSLPLDKLNPAGSITGPVKLAWKKSPADGVAELALDITAPAHPADSQLPVNATVRGRYSVRAEVIDLSALKVTTPHAHVEASGRLGSTSAALKMAVNVTSLTEFEPLLAAMGNTPLPVELAGQAGFNGTLSGRLRTPQIAGHLQATNFTYIYTPPAPAQLHAAALPSKRRSWFHLASSAPSEPASPAAPHPRRIHIDEFSGDVQYSQSALALHNAEIKQASTLLKLDGKTTLDRGSFGPSSQFQVQAAIHNADVGELQRAAGLDYPVTGTLNFTVQAAGTQANPHAQGQFSLSNGEAYGRPIKSLTSKILFANRAGQLEDIHLQAMRGTITGSAGYDFGNRTINLDLSGHSIDLSEMPEAQTERLHFAGAANFTAKGSGTLEEPAINAHLQIDNLVLNGEPIGSLAADAVTRGRQLQLTARSSFPKASLALDANVTLQGDMPGNATLQFAHLDINPFLPVGTRNQVTRHALLDGHAQVSGPLKQPRLWHGSLSIHQLSAEVQHIAITSDGPIELSLANEVVTVQHCTFLSEDTRFTLAGTAALDHQRRLDLHGSGQLNLKLLQTINPDLGAYGISNIDLTVNGTASEPNMTGRVDILHAGLSMVDFPVGVGDLNGSLVFNQDRLEVERLVGRAGGGQVTIGGFITYGRTIGFDLTADGNDIRLRYAGISVTSDQELRFAGTLQNSSLRGDVTVTRFAQIPSSDLQLILAQATTPARIPNPKSPLNTVHLDVRILSTPELTVQTSLAKLSGDVDLRLRGTAEKPVLLGRINIAEGDIKLGGAKYHLERGDISFLDPVRIDPVLDVEATTRVRDYDITIGLHGTMERLNTTYRSDPPLSSDDIVSLLAFGRTQQESAMGTTPSPGFAENASGAILSEAINQAVSNRVSKIFGVSAIRINPSVGGPDNDPNARLTLEQQVSNNITFTYITNLARSAQQVIQFEYNINSEYTVQGIRDENGVVSIDLLIRKRKR